MSFYATFPGQHRVKENNQELRDEEKNDVNQILNPNNILQKVEESFIENELNDLELLKSCRETEI